MLPVPEIFDQIFLKLFQWKASLINEPTPASFLFIFCLFKHIYYRKTVGFSEIRTQIVLLEGKHADPLTTTAALERLFCKK